jgi:hypothetical protein
MKAIIKQKKEYSRHISGKEWPQGSKFTKRAVTIAKETEKNERGSTTFAYSFPQCSGLVCRVIV